MEKQMSLSYLSDELAQVRTKKKEFLTQVEQIIPWGEWEAIIQPYYYKGERGNKPYVLKLMLHLRISEKLFRTDRTFIGSKSERVQSSQSMSTKLFIEFVALIVRNRIYNLLKEQMVRMEARQKYLTVPAAIRELEKIEMICRNNKVYRLDYAVTRTQKVTLSSFGLGETDIKKAQKNTANCWPPASHSLRRRNRMMARKRSTEAIEAEIKKVKTDMSKQQDRYDKLADKPKDLLNQKRRLEADVIIEAYLKSGKSLDEIMTFLNP